jgi:hypothetical protein
MWQTSLVVFHTYIYINNYCDISGIKLLKASEARIANDDSGVLIDERTIIPSRMTYHHRQQSAYDFIGSQRDLCDDEPLWLGDGRIINKR